MVAVIPIVIIVIVAHIVFAIALLTLELYARAFMKPNEV